MTDTKLLRHSLDSAAPLKPQKRRPLGRQVSGSPGPGTAHSVRAQGGTLSGLLPTPEVRSPPLSSVSRVTFQHSSRS
ncbi:unnamed protein product, partial [Rangifer tarandus platyrhynchus]